MITFKRIRWKNFLSTGNLFTEINFQKSDTTLIVGENGAGKSTILDALTFVLFGKSFRKINKPQLVNSITKKNLVCEIEFQIGNVEYKIRRGMSPALFEVYKNGDILNQTAETKDYQEILEKQILKINYKTFCQVVILGSASFVPFMQLTAQQRRDIIEDLLDLEIFSQMNALLKDRDKTNGDSILITQADTKVVSEKLKLVKDQIVESQNANQKIVEEKKQIINDTLDKMSALEDRCIEIDMQINDLQLSIEDRDAVQKKLDKLQKLRHQLEAKIKILENDQTFFKEHTDCPTCKQAIDESFREKTIESKSQELTQIENGLQLLLDQYNDCMNRIKQIDQVNTSIRSLSLDIHKMQSNIESLLQYKISLEKEIQSISKRQDESDKKKLTDLEQELIATKSKLEELTNQRMIIGAAGTLLKDSGIKAKIIKQYIPIINKLINKYLSAMDFFVQFELDEEFNETIRSRFRDDFSYSSFSEGEKMRINLAILFTWRAVSKLRNSTSTNLLIMDEVFDGSLDANGTEEFLKVINNFTKDTNTFIISHKTDQMYDKFHSIIKFEKKQNFSRMI